jgi:hypothetical protein
MQCIGTLELLVITLIQWCLQTIFASSLEFQINVSILAFVSVNQVLKESNHWTCRPTRSQLVAYTLCEDSVISHLHMLNAAIIEVYLYLLARLQMHVLTISYSLNHFNLIKFRAQAFFGFIYRYQKNVYRDTIFFDNESQYTGISISLPGPNVRFLSYITYTFV